MERAKLDQFEYVRNYYGVPAKKGGRVRVKDDAGSHHSGAVGTITSATHYVFVRLDGQKHDNPWHPTDLEYLDV